MAVNYTITRNSLQPKAFTANDERKIRRFLLLLLFLSLLRLTAS